MKKYLLVLSVIALLLSMEVSAALAQLSGRPQMTRSDRWEFSIQTRYTWAQDYQGDEGSSISVSDDLGWGFGFAYNFNQHFNLGFVFAWRSMPYEATAIKDDGSGETYKYSSQLDTSTLGLTGEYNILKGKFTPYVNGSWAWFNVNTNIFAGWGSGCWWDPIWGYVCGAVPLTYGVSTSTYVLGLGARYEFTDKVFARVGYERGWVGSGSVDSADMLRIDLGFLF